MGRGKQLLKRHIEGLRQLRELVTMDSLLIAKHGRLRIAGNDTGQQDDHSLAVPAATAGKVALALMNRRKDLEVLQADAILSHSACKSTRRDTAMSTTSSPRWPAMAR